MSMSSPSAPGPNMQQETPAASTLQGPSQPPEEEEEDDGDLNKSLGVQRFQQILSTPAALPDEQHRYYHEEDIAYHRHSSHHIHRPLAKLPSGGGRRRRSSSSSKRRRRGPDREHKAAPGGSSIDEGGEEDDEEVDDEEEEGVDGRATPSVADGAKDVQFFVSDEDPRADDDGPALATRPLEIVPSMGACDETEDATSTEE